MASFLTAQGNQTVYIHNFISEDRRKSTDLRIASAEGTQVE